MQGEAGRGELQVRSALCRARARPYETKRKNQLHHTRQDRRQCKLHHDVEGTGALTTRSPDICAAPPSLASYPPSHTCLHASLDPPRPWPVCRIQALRPSQRTNIRWICFALIACAGVISLPLFDACDHPRLGRMQHGLMGWNRVLPRFTRGPQQSAAQDFAHWSSRQLVRRVPQG